MCHVVKRLVNAIEEDNMTRLNPDHLAERKARREKEQKAIKSVKMQRMEVCLKTHQKSNFFLSERSLK